MFDRWLRNYARDDAWIASGVVFDPTGGLVTAATMGMTAIGGAFGTAGTIASGNIANQAAQYKATQDTINSSQALAAAQRQSLDQQTRTRMALSTLRARGAASGVDVSTSPGSVALASGIASRGAYNAGMSLWQGQNQQVGLLNEAAGERASGQAAEIGSEYAAAGTIANTGASMLQRYSFIKNMPTYGTGGSGMS